MNRVGTQLALTLDVDASSEGMNFEDREEFARRDDHDSFDWSLSSGAPRGIEEATRGRRFPVSFGLEGSDDSGCGGGSVLRIAWGRGREDRTLPTIRKRVDGSRTSNSIASEGGGARMARELAPAPLGRDHPVGWHQHPLRIA